MHESSWLKAKLFVKHYVTVGRPASGPVRVLEVGSRSYIEQETYRPLFPPPAFAYTGLDVVDGPNVDIVPANGYVWSEIADEAFDICVSGQTFEHNPFFWVTFAEIARVLSPGGLAFIVAPGSGEIHRYPYDCWRFYPDAWLGLCAMTGLELVESYFESDEAAALIPGGVWRDCAAIVRKPLLEGEAKQAFYSRLEALVGPFEGQSFAVEAPRYEPGPCFAEYNEIASRTRRIASLKDLRRAIRRRNPPALHKGGAYRGG